MVQVHDEGDEDGVATYVAVLPDVDVGVVRRHLTEADLLVRWWAQEADSDPVTGGRFELRWPAADHVMRGRWLRVDEDVVELTWAFVGSDLPERRVRHELVAQEGGTRLTVRHGHGGGDERAGHLEGWRHFLPRLHAAAVGDV